MIERFMGIDAQYTFIRIPEDIDTCTLYMDMQDTSLFLQFLFKQNISALLFLLYISKTLHMQIKIKI